MFHRVAILGVGLIGGSLGLSIRKKRLAKEVVGVCKTSRSVALAKRRGAIDWGTTLPLRAIQGADLVILATPIRVIPHLVRSIARRLKPGCLLTDVASTKGSLTMEIEELLPSHVSFVGSHPMAGRETRGVSHAIPTLFEGNICFVTPTRHTSSSSLRTIREFWRRIGCRVKVVKLKEHDRIVSSLSHLPHLLAALLVLNAEGIEWAGTGFKDMTRIASSDPWLWRDILLSNQREILRSSRQFRKRFDRVTRHLEKKDAEAILHLFEKAKHLRDRLVR
ncbi:MAG: prephenate dehydrogenase [Candidatus Omnitrophica bacterium]|nr:prephenate dehydrogenase [Candidatus Omnitrophota bacterium]